VEHCFRRFLFLAATMISSTQNSKIKQVRALLAQSKGGKQSQEPQHRAEGNEMSAVSSEPAAAWGSVESC
jgi:hypothetical protein